MADFSERLTMSDVEIKRLWSLTDEQFVGECADAISGHDALGEWAVPWLSEVWRRFKITIPAE